MLKEELRKILLSLSFVFVAAVSCAQYVVTGGSGSPMKATQSSGDSAERLEVYLVYGMDNVTISYTSSSSSSLLSLLLFIFKFLFGFCVLSSCSIN